MDNLNHEEIKVIKHLKEKGWCVVLFSPTELNDTDADNMEEVLIERGWNFIGEVNGG